MDSVERAKYKQLANDSIIATFGRDGNEARLAQALEKCVDELEEVNDKCPTCSACEDHGNGDGIVINAEDITPIHRSLAGIVSKLKDSPVGLLAENLASLEDGLDELEATTLR